MKFKGSSRQKIEFLNRSEKKTQLFFKTIENKVVLREKTFFKKSAVCSNAVFIFFYFNILNDHSLKMLNVHLKWSAKPGTLIKSQQILFWLVISHHGMQRVVEFEQRLEFKN